MEDGKSVTVESKNTLNNIYYFINNMEFLKAFKITAICNNTKLGIRSVKRSEKRSVKFPEFHERCQDVEGIRA